MRLIDADKLIYQSHAQHIQPYINKKDIDNAPTVEMAEDCISRADTIKWLKKVTVTEGIEFKTGFEQIIYDIEQMPSVQPQPKRGKWKVIRKEYEFMGGIVNEPQGCKCSNCGGIVKLKSDFCPNCGADMREVQDDNKIHQSMDT